MMDVLLNDWAFGRQDLYGLLHRLGIDNRIDVNVMTASWSVHWTRRLWLVVMDDLNFGHDRRVVMDNWLFMVVNHWLLNVNWAVRSVDGWWRAWSVNASHSSVAVAVTATAAARSGTAAAASSVTSVVMTTAPSRRI